MFKNKLYVYGDDKVQVPVHMHFGKEILDKMIEYGDMIALRNSDNDEKMTYLELAQQTADVAFNLTRIGVKKGDIVSLCSDKRFEVMPTVLGIICAGAVFSPSDITYGTLPLLHRLNITKPKVMFCSPSAYELHKNSFDSAGCIEKYIIYGEKSQFGELSFKSFLYKNVNLKDFLPIPVEGWKDFVLVMFSSGTTGLPKGVPVTHLGLLMNTSIYTDHTFKGCGLLNTREWYYSYGLGYTVGGLRAGSEVIFSLKNELVDWLKAIDKYKIKILQMSPMTVTELIKSTELDKFDVSSVETIISSSTPIRAEKIEAVKQRIPHLLNLYQMYGLSEAGCPCTEVYAKFGPRSGSVGTPCPGFVFKVVDIDTNEILGLNKRGEIRLKSPCITPGYLHVENRDYMDSEGFFKTGDVGYYDEDGYFYIVNRIKELIKHNDISVVDIDTNEILGLNKRGEIRLKSPCITPGYLHVENRDYMDSEGFFKTGDVGYYDEDGYFYIVNRIKELIKHNDISIAPAELEGILEQHPQIVEAGVTGVNKGKILVALVVTQHPHPLEGEIMQYINSRITYRMHVNGVHRVDKLPRGAGGKLDRNSLHKQALQFYHVY